jgi:hypothetical protein
VDKKGVAVRLGLEEEAIEKALDRLEQAVFQVELEEAPPTLRQAIIDVRVARLQAKICERKKELLEAAVCESLSAKPAEAILVQLLQGIELALPFEGGIPIAEGKYLRPLVVVATMDQLGRSQVVSGLPLLLSVNKLDEEAARLQLITDEKGRISFDLRKTSIDTPLALSIDTERLPAMPKLELKLSALEPQARAVGMERSLVIVRKSDAVAGKAALSKLERGLAHLRTRIPQIDGADLKTLSALSPHKWKDELPSLADAQEGKLDLVIFVEAESEFASRMGTHRVWFEARGKLTVVNAWNGRTLFQVDALTTESGVGETRAESAAREVLGTKLAEKLKEEWKVQAQTLDPPREGKLQRQSLGTRGDQEIFGPGMAQSWYTAPICSTELRVYCFEN